MQVSAGLSPRWGTVNLTRSWAAAGRSSSWWAVPGRRRAAALGMPLTVQMLFSLNDSPHTPESPAYAGPGGTVTAPTAMCVSSCTRCERVSAMGMALPKASSSVRTDMGWDDDGHKGWP